MKNNYSEKVSIQDFFYPLDKIKSWNKLYGKNGFLQYQFVIPKENALKNIYNILEIISKSKQTPFLSVLKEFKDKNKNILSFPMKGYTLALDFKNNTNVKSLIKKLDSIIVDLGGKIYLTKDALMDKKTFRKTYLNIKEFLLSKKLKIILETYLNINASSL